jgi:hypothetical protein
MNKKRLFFNFLQENNALKAYKQAYKRFRNASVSPNEYTPLAVAFIWHGTPEGHEYWKSLDQQWHDYLRSSQYKFHF